MLLRDKELVVVGDRDSLDVEIQMRIKNYKSSTVIYLSCPITGGIRFLKWWKEKGHLITSKETYKAEHYASVIEPNIKMVQSKISDIKKNNRFDVEDPTDFNRPTWTQDEYRYFWGKIIEKKASMIIFLNGWELSEGCIYEFLTAVTNRIATFDENNNKIEYLDGLKMIKEAIKTLKKERIKTEFMERIIFEIEKLIANSVVS